MKLRRTGVLLAALALVATGCRDSGDEGDGDGALGAGCHRRGVSRRGQRGQRVHLPRHHLRPDPGAVRAARGADHRGPEGVLAAGQRGRRHRRLRHQRHRVRPRQPLQPADPQAGLRRDRGRRARAGADPRVTDHPGDHPRHAERRDGRRPGLLDLAVGLRGRHPRVRHQLLRRGHERRRLHGRREGHQLGDGRPLPR